MFNDLINTNFHIVWKRSVYHNPDNTVYNYAIDHRYCRCLGHEPGTSTVYEISYDTIDHKWGYVTIEDHKINFTEANRLNPPYYWCYLRDVENKILISSEFLQE